MACMEHECPKCNKTVFNNVPVMYCCGEKMRSYFDEQRDHDEKRSRYRSRGRRYDD